MVQEYAAYPDYIDFLQQHGYALAAEFAVDCLHQNTHENCKHMAQTLTYIHSLKHKKETIQRYEYQFCTEVWCQNILTRPVKDGENTR